MKKKVQSTFLQQRLEAEENFSIAFPSLFKFSTSPTESFRGLTAFVGDSNAVVVGVKRFTEDGVPEIMWSSGTDLLDALVNLDAALKSGKWRVDKRANV